MFMKKSFVSRFALTGLVILTLIAPAFGAGKKKPTAKPTPHDIVISAVSGNAVTVTDENSTKTVTVTQFTEITVNGQKATIADLKPGMTVNLGLKGPTEASRITAITKK